MCRQHQHDGIGNTDLLLRFFLGGSLSSGFFSSSLPGIGPHRAAPRLRTGFTTAGSTGSTPADRGSQSTSLGSSSHLLMQLPDNGASAHGAMLVGRRQQQCQDTCRTVHQCAIRTDNAESSALIYIFTW